MSPLTNSERIHYRDLLREARYGALADAEGFQQMCFAIEALGKRLNSRAIGLSGCQGKLKVLVNEAGILNASGEIQGSGKRFDALFIALKDARNDFAHTGAYARHVATEAVTLCTAFEDALMHMRITVADFMVTTPVIIQSWQSMGFARQLMLLNSFSYLPMWDSGKWWLVTDIAVAKYLRSEWPDRQKMNKTIIEANKEADFLVEASTVNSVDLIDHLLEKATHSGLWLVVQDGYPEGHLVGVLSPFELM